MCGICGFYSKKEYNDNLLRRMNNSMTHRGPNDSEELMFAMKGGYAGIAHRRLSIFDLSLNGHQPMISDDGNVILSYNGEIYNFREIRNGLEKKGYNFKSECDTEVLLYAYMEYGIDAVNHFNGMFAFAVIEKDTGKIVLCRDRIGVKPLYYYFDGDTFIWGSELKPLMLHPEFKKEIRTELISRYLCYKYINSPDTIFKNTYKVEPGEQVIFKNGELNKRKYWDVIEKYYDGKKHEIIDYSDAKNHIKELIIDSVSKRMVADVPVGIWLSGGIDSSLIAAVAQTQSDRKIKTFTVGMETKEEDEAVYAKEVAKCIGTDHTEIYISEQELLQLIDDLAVYYDEPFADSSQIATMAVAAITKEEVEVVLSGDGGDELFCGYSMYDWALKAQRYDMAGKILYRCGGRYFSNCIPDKLYALMMNRDDKLKAQLFTDVRQRYSRRMVLGYSMEAKYDFEQYIEENNLQVKRMLVDMKSYLPDEVLAKTDRATMKYSLEGRNPLVDYRLVEESFRIPHDFKYHNGEKKYILKDITYDYVDKKLLDRPKKGFGVPLELWMRTYLYDRLCDYARPDVLQKQGIFNSDEIWKFIYMLKRSDKSVYNSMMWSFFVFQNWYQHYIEDLWA